MEDEEYEKDNIQNRFVGDYIFPEDNNNGEESIVIDAIGNKNPVELFRSDISSISIIE